MVPQGRTEIAARLQAALALAPGTVSVELTTSDGWTWGSDADRTVPSASTVKVPILVAALADVEAGHLALDAVIDLPPERVGGSGPLSLLPSLTRLPLGELLSLMVALSDNDATNRVIDLVGIEAVAQILAMVPTRQTSLRRKMMDFAAAERGLENVTSAADLVATMVALREGRLLGAVGTRTALDILRSQQFREGLPAYLPADVRVASKTGEIHGVRGDVALLERGAGWVAVAALATGLADGDVDRGTAVLPTFAAIGQIAAELL